MSSLKSHPASLETIAGVRKVVDEHGLERAARDVFGCAQLTIASCCAGFSIQQRSRELLETRLRELRETKADPRQLELPISRVA